MLTAPAGLDPAGLFSRFDIASRPAVVAAVSGGSDSTALLLLLKAYLDRHDLPGRLVAVTVDHRLRPASGTEAQHVAALCRSLGIEHRIAAWDGPKPASGVAAAARLARYELLAEAAWSVGTDLVLTGHTADDQAETVLMRQARGGGRGLAGMAPVTLLRGRSWLLRPLLGRRRTELRAQLRRHGVDWIEDPTNIDSRFERARLRADMAGDEAAETLREASIAAARRTELGARAARFIADNCMTASGEIWLPRGWPQARMRAAEPAAGSCGSDRDSTDQQAAVYALRILVAVMGNADHLPDLPRTCDLWQRLTAGGPARTSLSRCLIESCDNHIRMRRDMRGHAGPAMPLRLSPWADFLPCFDLAPARAVARLIGAPMPPAPPFALPSACHSAG